MTKRNHTLDLSIARRKYTSDECSLTVCPECGSEMLDENCTILLYAKSDSDEGRFMTNLSGSRFCTKCPVVVFDTEKVERAAKVGIRGDKNLRYRIDGIIDLDSIPDHKKRLEIGCDENPVPLVP